MDDVRAQLTVDTRQLLQGVEEPDPLTSIDVVHPGASLRMPEVRSPTEDEDGVLGLRSARDHPVDARGDSTPERLRDVEDGEPIP
jgi:hypothetical protein